MADSKPLEIIINCGDCKEETERTLTNEECDSSTIYGPRREFILLNKPFHTYDCAICLTLCKYLEERRENYDKMKERRKDK
ncbi:MAG: hypothetical protein KKE23_01845 [Nanoarchaeota archaeon]|nr:hypothetical protein [Nanoarchaeota archaeon]